MGAANGAKAINAGTIVAKNAYGMFIGTSKNGTETPTIQNDGRIVVEGQGAGFELGGAGVKGIGINNGTITVGEVFDKNKGKDEWAHGVLINTATNTFENNGTINATAEGTSAIEVKDGATTTTLNFGEKSGECQDFCVWGGYSRGSPTRLPFVFEMQYARPDAIAREV